MIRVKFVLALLSSMIFTMAYGGNKSVVVEYLDNTEKEFYMNLLKRIVINGNDLSLMGNDETTLETADISSIRKISFVSDEDSGISAIADTCEKLTVYLANEEALHVEVGTTGKIIRIFDTKGQIHHSAVLSDNTTEINISAFADGIYLLQYGNNIVKFIKQ